MAILHAPKERVWDILNQNSILTNPCEKKQSKLIELYNPGNALKKKFLVLKMFQRKWAMAFY